LLGWVVRSQLAKRKRETERKRKQNSEKENVRRKERGQENVECRYEQNDEGRRGQSEVENGHERGTKGPTKGVTKRAEAEGDRGEIRRGRRARGRKRSMLTPSELPSRDAVQPPLERWRPSWRRMQISMAPRRPPATLPDAFAVCTYTRTRACVCAYLARVYTHHWRNQSIDRATDRPTGKQASR